MSEQPGQTPLQAAEAVLVAGGADQKHYRDVLQSAADYGWGERALTAAARSLIALQRRREAQ